MGIEKFKLPRSSYEQLSKIIKAYWQLQEASSLGQVDQICGIGTSNISSNNPFLVAVGILERGQKKVASEMGRSLGLALAHDKKEEIQKQWQQVIKNNDFLNKMLSAVRIRKGMGLSDFDSHIAYSSGESKATYVMTGARAVVDIFKASGLVEEKDDRILPTSEGAIGVTEHAEEKKPRRDFEEAIKEKEKIGLAQLGKDAVSLNIQVRIEAKPSELDGLGEKLKTLIDSLGEGSTNKIGE